MSSGGSGGPAELGAKVVLGSGIFRQHRTVDQETNDSRARFGVNPAQRLGVSALGTP